MADDDSPPIGSWPIAYKNLVAKQLPKNVHTHMYAYSYTYELMHTHIRIHTLQTADSRGMAGIFT